MSPHEVPLEQTQEDLLHHAHGATQPWILGVALTAALLAVLAAITALLAEHHANEALIEQVQSSDQWNLYQARSIKEKVISCKNDLLIALGKTPDPKDLQKLEKYDESKDEDRLKAKELERSAEAHLKHHTVLARGVTMFQVAIAIGAISVLTNRKWVWMGSLAFGAVGVFFFLQGILMA